MSRSLKLEDYQVGHLRKFCVKILKSNKSCLQDRQVAAEIIKMLSRNKPEA